MRLRGLLQVGSRYVIFLRCLKKIYGTETLCTRVRPWLVVSHKYRQVSLGLFICVHTVMSVMSMCTYPIPTCWLVSKPVGQARNISGQICQYYFRICLQRPAPCCGLHFLQSPIFFLSAAFLLALLHFPQDILIYLIITIGILCLGELRSKGLAKTIFILVFSSERKPGPRISQCVDFGRYT